MKAVTENIDGHEHALNLGDWIRSRQQKHLNGFVVSLKQVYDILGVNKRELNRLIHLGIVPEPTRFNSPIWLARDILKICDQFNSTDELKAEIKRIPRK